MGLEYGPKSSKTDDMGLRQGSKNFPHSLCQWSLSRKKRFHGATVEALFLPTLPLASCLHGHALMLKNWNELQHLCRYH